MPFSYIIVLVIVVSIIVFLYLIEPLISRQKLKNNNEHGSARWATKKEIDKKFRKDYIEIRDDALKDIKSSSNEWSKFISFWSRIIDKYSIDNILNLYSYNPYGRVFKTFDEWNSNDIDRRIKPKSRGIPILDNDNKTYVFEIGQTYGKDYYEWTYNHIDDDIVLNYYQDKIGIKKDKSLLYNQNFYNTFKTITKDTIIKNYLDLSTPKNDGSFNVYDDIKDKLVKKGIPEDEIEFIHNAKTDEQKSKLFEKMRNGKKRILIGSTAKMGAGTNIQDKLVAVHHLDCPWRPSDIEQRNGRILRRGNQNEEVEIIFYITEGSLDTYIYQLNEIKSKFINQIMQDSNSGGRIAEDLDRDTLNYAEIKAIASGNKLILEKFKVDDELEKLYLSKSRYDKSHIELENKYTSEIPRTLSNLNKYLDNLKSDIESVKDLSGDNFTITIKDTVFTSRKEASTKFYECLSILKTDEETKIGEISGFDIIGTREDLRFTPVIYIKGAGKYKIEINNYDEIGNIIKLENMLKSFESKIDKTKDKISYNEKQLIDIKEELDKPFTQQDRIRQLQKEKARIDSELDLDKQENTRSIEETNDEEMER